ncbi:MAG: hypothetical protein RR873_04265, partial [Christensenella sp.]
NAEHFGSRELAPLRGLWAEPQGLGVLRARGRIISAPTKAGVAGGKIAGNCGRMSPLQRMYNPYIFIRNAKHFGSRELAPLRGLWAEPQGLGVLRARGRIISAPTKAGVAGGKIAGNCGRMSPLQRMYNPYIFIRNAKHFGSRELAPLRGIGAEPRGFDLKGFSRRSPDVFTRY